MINVYNPITVGQFEQGCNAQGVNFSTELRMATMRKREQNARELATEIADLLMYRRVQLVTAVISEPVHPQDNVSAILRMMLNANVKPPTLDDDATNFPQQSFIDVQRCPEAEQLFAVTLDELRNLESDSKISQGGRVYVNQHGEAAILQKSPGYSSGVVLGNNLHIGGIPMPRGALLHLEAGEDDIPGYDVLPRDKLTIRPLSDITRIAFVRLTAFASEPAQREIDSATPDTIGESAFKLLSGITVAQLQPLVQKAVVAIK